MMQMIPKMTSRPMNTISIELRMTSIRSTYVCQSRRYKKPKSDVIVKISDTATVKTCSVRFPLYPEINIKLLSVTIHSFCKNLLTM